MFTKSAYVLWYYYLVNISSKRNQILIHLMRLLTVSFFYLALKAPVALQHDVLHIVTLGLWNFTFYHPLVLFLIWFPIPQVPFPFTAYDQLLILQLETNSVFSLPFTYLVAKSGMGHLSLCLPFFFKWQMSTVEK